MGDEVVGLVPHLPDAHQVSELAGAEATVLPPGHEELIQVPLGQLAGPGRRVVQDGVDRAARLDQGLQVLAVPGYHLGSHAPRLGLQVGPQQVHAHVARPEVAQVFDGPGPVAVQLVERKLGRETGGIHVDGPLQGAGHAGPSESGL
ncbi:hypothetical protein D3C87_1516840 [compost metagenome]